MVPASHNNNDDDNSSNGNSQVPSASQSKAKAIAYVPPPDPETFMARLAEIPVRKHPDMSSVLVEPVTESPYKVETKKSVEKTHRAYVNQNRIESLRTAKTPPDWRYILRSLFNWTPTYGESLVPDAIVVTIPKDHCRPLLDTASPHSLWSIQAQTGCIMRFYPRGGAKGSEGYEIGDLSWASEPERRDYLTKIQSIPKDISSIPCLAISGDWADIRRGLYELLDATNNSITVNAGDKYIDSEFASVRVSPVFGGVYHVRSENQEPTEETVQSMLSDVLHWRETSKFKKYMLPTSSTTIPLPPKWTRDTFKTYLAALTLGQIPAGLGDKLYATVNGKLQSGSPKHQETVVLLIQEAFNDPAAAPYISLSAVKLALSEIVKMGLSHKWDGWRIIEAADRAGVKLDVEVFNLLLKIEVKHKHLRGFYNLLQALVRRGLSPNIETWTLYLRLIEAEEVKRHILHLMHEKGLLKAPGALKAVARAMAKHDTYRAVQLGYNLETFWSEQERLYGSNWLDGVTGPIVVDVLGQYGKFDMLQGLVERVFAEADVAAGGPVAEVHTKRRLRPNWMTLKALLTHCVRQRRLDQAIELVDLFERNGFVIQTPDIFELLLEMAWNRNNAFLYTLIWRYANMVCGPPAKFRRRTLDLLKSGEEGEKAAARFLRPWRLPSHASLTGVKGKSVQDKVPVNSQVIKRLLLTVDRDDDVLVNFQQDIGTAAPRPFTTQRMTWEELVPKLAWWHKTFHYELEPTEPLAPLMREARARDKKAYKASVAGEEWWREKGALVPPTIPTRRKTKTKSPWVPAWMVRYLREQDQAAANVLPVEQVPKAKKRRGPREDQPLSLLEHSTEGEKSRVTPSEVEQTNQSEAPTIDQWMQLMKPSRWTQAKRKEFRGDLKELHMKTRYREELIEKKKKVEEEKKEEEEKAPRAKMPLEEARRHWQLYHSRRKEQPKEAIERRQAIIEDMESWRETRRHKEAAIEEAVRRRQAIIEESKKWPEERERLQATRRNKKAAIEATIEEASRRRQAIMEVRKRWRERREQQKQAIKERARLLEVKKKRLENRRKRHKLWLAEREKLKNPSPSPTPRQPPPQAEKQITTSSPDSSQQDVLKKVETMTTPPQVEKQPTFSPAASQDIAKKVEEKQQADTSPDSSPVGEKEEETPIYLWLDQMRGGFGRGTKQAWLKGDRRGATR